MCLLEVGEGFLEEVEYIFIGFVEGYSSCRLFQNRVMCFLDVIGYVQFGVIIDIYVFQEDYGGDDVKVLQDEIEQVEILKDESK